MFSNENTAIQFYTQQKFNRYKRYFKQNINIKYQRNQYELEHSKCVRSGKKLLIAEPTLLLKGSF